MDKVLVAMQRPKIKMTRKTWAILALVALIIFRVQFGNLLITLFNDILLLMWNLAGLIDKILFGVTPG